VKLLLDTCGLLWALHEPKKLSAQARKALMAPENRIYVSAVSFWEISLKASIGKLALERVVPQDFPGMVAAEGWEMLPLQADTAASFHNLPKVETHKDPFDRMLIHIAMDEGYHLVSKDAAFSAYSTAGLKVCW